MSEHFAVNYLYGPAEEQARHRPEHRAYLSELVDRGLLLASGPFTDQEEPGALLVFRAESAEEVEELTRGDPMHRHGVVREHRIRPWNPVLGVFVSSGL